MAFIQNDRCKIRFAGLLQLFILLLNHKRGDLMHSIAKNIKMIRKEKGWTQQQMADFLFVTRQTVSNWENGRAFPDLETFEQISEKLNIDSQYLLYGRLMEEKYRKLRALTFTTVGTALLFLFMIIEKLCYLFLSRISKYAGYYILGSGVGYGDFVVGIAMMFFVFPWSMVLLVNWAVADDYSVNAKFIKGCTNIFLSFMLLYSSYSMATNCIYTYRRYENVVIKAHQRLELTDNPSGFWRYREGSLEFIASGYAYNIAYIDDGDKDTQDFIDHLINSQALRIARFDIDSSPAQSLISRNYIKSTPAVIIGIMGNYEVLEGYEEISSKLEAKIHNYKMHNIFFY